LRLNDVGDGHHGLLEGVDGVAVGAPHGHEDQRLEGQAQRAGIELCVVAADHAGAFQSSQPAVAGRDAEPDPFGEFGEGQPPVLLQLGKDLPINMGHKRARLTGSTQTAKCGDSAYPTANQRVNAADRPEAIGERQRSGDL